MCTKSVFRSIGRVFGLGGNGPGAPAPTALPPRAEAPAQSLANPEEYGMSREEMKKRNRFKLRLDQDFSAAPGGTAPPTLGV